MPARSAEVGARTWARCRTASPALPYEGVHKLGDVEVIIEDLPGTYSLDPISPDEEVVTEVLDAGESVHSPISGHVVLMDATQLRRGLGMTSPVNSATQSSQARLICTFPGAGVTPGGSRLPSHRLQQISALPTVMSLNSISYRTNTWRTI